MFRAGHRDGTLSLVPWPMSQPPSEPSPSARCGCQPAGGGGAGSGQPALLIHFVGSSVVPPRSSKDGPGRRSALSRLCGGHRNCSPQPHSDVVESGSLLAVLTALGHWPCAPRGAVVSSGGGRSVCLPRGQWPDLVSPKSGGLLGGPGRHSPAGPPGSAGARWMGAGPAVDPELGLWGIVPP